MCARDEDVLPVIFFRPMAMLISQVLRAFCPAHNLELAEHLLAVNLRGLLSDLLHLDSDANLCQQPTRKLVARGS